MARCSWGFGLLALALSFAVTTSSSAPAAQKSDLICPTENHEECYPRLFEPTEEFQQIKEGQELPPGLHVRMDVYSGTKEAKLYIPTAEDLALEASSSNEIVVVPEDGESAEAETKPDSRALRDKFPKRPPAYEKAGKILPPRPDDNSGDADSFRSALNVLKGFKDNFSSQHLDQDLDPALDVLFDLSNDIYYGVEITKDSDVLLILFTLMYSHEDNPGGTIRNFLFNVKGLSGSNRAPDSPQSVLRRRQAAGILGHAIQNNPTALSELTKEGVSWMEYLCVLVEAETAPAPMKSKIKALSHMLNDPKLRRDFVNISNSHSAKDDLFSNGTQVLLSAFLRKGREWDGVRTQVTELLLDNYVDVEMGADLGLWPIEPVAGDAKHCSKSAHKYEDACWEHHLEKIRPEVAGDKAKFEVLDKLLAALRSGREDRRAVEHVEL